MPNTKFEIVPSEGKFVLMRDGQAIWVGDTEQSAKAAARRHLPSGYRPRGWRLAWTRNEQGHAVAEVE